MGCGQSHIAVIYPRKSKQKGSSPQSEAGEENSDEERNGKQGNENEVAQMEEISQANEEEENEEKMRQMVQLSNSPLLAHQELSTSQSEFFKMLDEKINNGPDYEGTSEFEFTMDHTELCRMIQDWQMAKHKSKYGQPPKLQKFHSVQSNGEPPGMRPRLSHQSSLYSATPPTPPPQYNYPPPHYDPYQMRHYQHLPPQHYPVHPQILQQSYQPAPRYQQHGPPPNVYPPQPSFHHMGASSVVMYDKRGGYYTELA